MLSLPLIPPHYTYADYVAWYIRHFGNTIYETKGIVKNLVDPTATCVTVTGEPGSGKTEMAVQACMYLQKRHRFDAVFFADCSAAVMAAAPAPPLLGRSVSALYVDELCDLVRLNT